MMKSHLKGCQRVAFQWWKLTLRSNEDSPFNEKNRLKDCLLFEAYKWHFHYFHNVSFKNENEVLKGGIHYERLKCVSTDKTS